MRPPSLKLATPDLEYRSGDEDDTYGAISGHMAREASLPPFHIWKIHGDFWIHGDFLDTWVRAECSLSDWFMPDNEAKDVSGHFDITVAIDGTWQKHGHTSLNGAVIATSFYTGKVLDASILSRFLEAWKFQEPSKSSNALKVCMVCDIPNFWADDDTRAYKAVIEMQPYGDTGIEKLECVGYVKKWMGTRLPALKLKMKCKKLSDKKTLDDYGRLADAEIDKLQRYYGLSIRNNTDNINSINSMH
ncbi:uncharacterized protein TNCV_2689901 [Trichonephila clavipes]|uniref:Mutator-like transposase domain-containing protein n=1 Tax=Trichonephila clavipes TaxID=2585209 RepID=A0A8X7BBK5_TRICX|nr:uncharacterized protein TNCV_2689901 [Trichonephila clavipes]